MNSPRLGLLGALVLTLIASAALAQEKPIVGLIPKATKPIKLDGKLDEWSGAFVTPVNVGHPDFANRGAEFLYLWDDDNLYVGLRSLDQHPAHFGSAIWDGDAVEFYLDTRRGDQLGAQQFGAGSLHMFWTPLTKTEFKPRWAVRDLPAFKDFKLQGAEVAGEKTRWGWTAEFKLPWSNFPNFKAKAGEVIGIDCELCSSDGGPRADRTFVYSSPDNVTTPSAFGRVKLVDTIEPGDLESFGRVLLPMSLTKSANYGWLYCTVCISPTIDKAVAKIEGKILDGQGKVRKSTMGNRKTLDGSGLAMWTGSWELFDLPPGIYTVDVSAFDKAGKLVAARTEKILHGEPAAAASATITKGQRIFSTGHSFHNGFPPILDEMAKSGGFNDSAIVGVSSIGGSKVVQHWDGKAVQTALSAGKVDVLMTTPIYLPDPGIEKFATLGFDHNPNFRLTMMEFWLPFDQYEPRNYSNGLAGSPTEHLQPPAKVDHNAATGESLRKIHDRYFREMDALAEEINKKLGKQVVFVVPVGKAVIALREKIIAGQAPGLKSQEEIFADTLGHPKSPLTIMMGYCHYAVIYRKSPIGLPVPRELKVSGDAKDLEALNRLLQELAWNAVVDHPLSGVRTDQSPASAAKH